MPLTFPNASRNYDRAHHRVCFWGYEGLFEVALFVDEAALARLVPDLSKDEAGYLRAFDDHRPRIMAAADAMHARRRKTSHTLTAPDF